MVRFFLSLFVCNTIGTNMATEIYATIWKRACKFNLGGWVRQSLLKLQACSVLIKLIGEQASLIRVVPLSMRFAQLGSYHVTCLWCHTDHVIVRVLCDCPRLSLAMNMWLTRPGPNFSETTVEHIRTNKLCVRASQFLGVSLIPSKIVLCS